jgi:hypothetical protein
MLLIVWREKKAQRLVHEMLNRIWRVIMSMSLNFDQNTRFSGMINQPGPEGRERGSSESEKEDSVEDPRKRRLGGDRLSSELIVALPGEEYRGREAR